MPRRKPNGSRGNSPEKPVNGRGGVYQTASQSKGDQIQCAQTNNGSNYNTDVNRGRLHKLDQNDETFKVFEEMFKGRIESDVVHLVLSECDWNGNHII